MSLVRLDPFRSLSRWPAIWDEDFGLSTMTTANNNLDVYETEDEVVVRANVAGVPTDKVDITFEKGVLRITAEAVEEAEEHKKQHYSKSSWSYSYRVVIPGMEAGMIDLDSDPDATVEHGVVTVKFKKSKASKSKKVVVTAK